MLKGFFSRLAPEENSISSYIRIKGRRSLFLYCVITGIVSGLGAFLFSRALAWAEYISLASIAGLQETHSGGEYYVSLNPISSILLGRWALLFLPIIGGLITGWIVWKFSPDSSGTGTDSLIDSFHNKEGKVDPKVPVIKSIATIFTLSSGGSGGKEGPISLIGAGFGSLVANLTKAGARARRTLLLAGTAGGLGAIFHAPLGGALTSVEMVYREDIESDSLVPCIISSVTAYLVYSSLNGFGAVYKVPEIGFEAYKELIFYLMLGIVCYLSGAFLIRSFQFIQNWSKTWHLPIWIKPAIGGIPVGIIGYFLPEVMGTGAGFLQDILEGTYHFESKIGSFFQSVGVASNSGSDHIQFFANSLRVDLDILIVLCFLLFAFLKIVTTSFTIGTGGSAGMFGPSLFIGGMLGGAVGTLAKLILGYKVSIASFVLVGMGAFYAGIASAPIAGMVMICEIIGSYYLLPPLMIVSITSFVLSHKLNLYKSQKGTRFQSPAHYWDMNRDLLEEIRISDISDKLRNIAVIRSSSLLSHLEEDSIKINASDYVVLDPEGKYFGMLSLRNIRLYSEGRALTKNLVLVGDAADTSIRPISVSTSLAAAFKTLLDNGMDKIAVEEEGKYLGYLRYADIISIYFERTRSSRPISP
ncbi:chloride channel protein [Leptospira langatensis]|uniref:Chloride channel protein n=1 Tax=Leptospira langatensis TaxID=2484983 RepID=A0A5F1ZUQ8_9LEPT|nr:chloride channel protein [Leptospira langatensis]TGK01538.1 chloride channel protein [Leptospira langatensis]TGL42012.1 chloride channel protein [Leptospira langatensis]